MRAWWNDNSERLTSALVASAQIDVRAGTFREATSEADAHRKVAEVSAAAVFSFDAKVRIVMACQVWARPSLARALGLQFRDQRADRRAELRAIGDQR